MTNLNRHSWIGIVLVAIGGLLIIDNFGIFNFDIRHLIFSWRTICLVIGIIILSNSKNSIAGLIFLLIGLWGYITFILPWSIRFAFTDLWPIIFIVVGLSLLLRRKSTSVHHARKHNNFTSDYSYTTTESQSDSDYLDEVAIFTTIRKTVVSENFKGGKMTALFGGVHLDFSKAKLAPGENQFEISCIFGGGKIYVPKNWKVIVNVTSVFGGIDDKRYINFEAQTTEGVLIIKGAVIFGGCEILSV